jgi:NADH:ubiquinone oxidoreductase subunit E
MKKSTKKRRQAQRAKKHDALMKQLAQLQQLQTWSLVALLTFMESSMGVGMDDVLGVVISDSPYFDQLVAKSRRGVAVATAVKDQNGRKRA